MTVYQILGWFTVVLFVLLVVKAPLKSINEKHKNKGLTKLNSMFTKYHKYFGILIVISAISHGILTGANLFSINPGSLALVGLIFTSVFGVLIKMVRNKSILVIHKALAVATLALIVSHVLLQL